MPCDFYGSSGAYDNAAAEVEWKPAAADGIQFTIYLIAANQFTGCIIFGNQTRGCTAPFSRLFLYFLMLQTVGKKVKKKLKLNTRPRMSRVLT